MPSAAVLFALVRLVGRNALGLGHGVHGRLQRIEAGVDGLERLFDLLRDDGLIHPAVHCGSAERERVEEAISRAFAPLQRGRVVPPVIAEKKNAPETPREITERMDVTQGRLSMGWRASTNDAPAMMLANLIFGGYSNSKLFLNVREKLSLCYYASSAYHRSKGIVTVSSGIECRDVETAKREILAQLASVQRGEFEEWEVEGARACLIASLESRGDSAGRMEENALGQAATGIRETADELIAALRAVTNERIAEAAQSMTLDTVYFLTGEDSKDE